MPDTVVSTPPLPTQSAAELREALRTRRPRPEALGRVRVSAPHSRSCYLQLMRVSGPREDVLDYAAYLFATEDRPPDASRAPLELAVVEATRDGELSLIISRALYSAG